MPELPEAERARQQIERARGRRIVSVEDSDTYVCRPHAPGELAAALTGHRLADAHRRGKFLWVETEEGPVLGLHLGMSGAIVLDQEPEARGWDRFALELEGGRRLALRDKRRLGRAVLNPDFSHVGPDAGEVSRDEFRARIGRGTAPIKARLMDQRTIAGVGNLLADEILYQAGIDPRRPSDRLSVEELDELRRATRATIRRAIRRGGAHTGEINPERVPGGRCPRCGVPLERARIGGRTTFWCPRHQR